MRNFSDNNVPIIYCRSATICGYPGVLAVLCVAKFGEGWAALPKDVLLHVLSLCGRSWFSPPHDGATAAGGEEAAVEEDAAEEA